MNTIPIDELKDTLTLALYATIFGGFVSIVLGMLGNALAVLPFLGTLVNLVLLIYLVPKIPREMKTFFGVLIVTLGILVVQGILSMVNIPMLSFLNWASISTLPNFITTLVAAVAGLYVADRAGLV